MTPAEKALSGMGSDDDAYAHMRKYGIHRTKKSGPRKGQTVHETVGGKPFSASRLSKLQAEAKKRTS